GGLGRRRMGRGGPARGRARRREVPRAARILPADRRLDRPPPVLGSPGARSEERRVRERAWRTVGAGAGGGDVRGRGCAVRRAVVLRVGVLVFFFEQKTAYEIET